MTGDPDHGGDGGGDGEGRPFHYTPGQSLGYLVRDTFRAFTRELEARIESEGVSIGQWYFLRALWEQDGLTQRELSRRVGMMEPTTVTAVNAMEARGLVRRVRDARDRRKVKVVLTPRGRRLEVVPVDRPCDRVVGWGRRCTTAVDVVEHDGVAGVAAWLTVGPVRERIPVNEFSNGVRHHF